MTPQEFVTKHDCQHYNAVRAMMVEADWSSVWPVVNIDGCLTGKVLDSGDADASEYELCDINEDGTLNYGDGCCEAAIQLPQSDWVDRHSADCYFCGEMFDEREGSPADPYNNGDGGTICANCLKEKQ